MANVSSGNAERRSNSAPASLIGQRSNFDAVVDDADSSRRKPFGDDVLFEILRDGKDAMRQSRKYAIRHLAFGRWGRIRQTSMFGEQNFQRWSPDTCEAAVNEGRVLVTVNHAGLMRLGHALDVMSE